MKQISQEEFEQCVRDMIDGKISKVKLVKELETDVRTLNDKIQLLSAINPQLYQDYVAVHSYRPKERKDLDPISLTLEIIRDGKTIQRLAQDHEAGVRTIRRKLDVLKNSDNEVERRAYDLCREVCFIHSKASSEMLRKINDKIDEIIPLLEGLQRKDNPIKDAKGNIEERRQELLAIEKRYNELCMTMPKEEAARTMGYTRNRVWKLLQELYRIEIESNTEKKNDFKESLHVETTALGDIDTRTDESDKIGREER